MFSLCKISYFILMPKTSDFTDFIFLLKFGTLSCMIELYIRLCEICVLYNVIRIMGNYAGAKQ